MSVIILGLCAVIIGFLLILFLADRKSQPETPEKKFHSDSNDPEINTLMTMAKQEFVELVKKLLSKLGFEIEEITAKSSEWVDFLIFNPQPIKGGRFVVHCFVCKENKFIESIDIINLLDNVKGESALKGILITPFFFTIEALSAAAGLQLELINGKRLVELLRENGLMYK